MNILKTKLEKYYKESLINKKYLFIYIISILIFFLSMMSIENYLFPSKEIIVFILMAFFGIFIINYHTLHSDELYKTAFIFIVVIGIFISILMPIAIGHDEWEHFVRALITSTGNIFPQFDSTHNGFLTTRLSVDIQNLRGITIFDPLASHVAINHTSVYFDSAFQQNPFFGYLVPSAGILIGEILNVPAVWTLIIGRFFSVILYAVCISIAVKKTPILKIPLLVVACMPLALFQGATLTIDVFINGISFIIIAYFLYMLKSDVVISKKELLIFFTLVCLTGMCKVTYFVLYLLIFLIPKDKFDKRYYIYALIGFVLLIIVALAYSKFYAIPSMYHSVRARHIGNYNVDFKLQVDYMLSHIPQTLIMLFQTPNYLYATVSELNIFSSLCFNSLLLSAIYPMFIGAIILLYPIKTKISNKVRIGSFIIIVLLYIGTYLTFLVSWTPVGDLNNIIGVQSRYFIPLFALIPIALNFNNKDIDSEKIDKITFIITIIFAVALVFLITTKFY